MLTNAVNALVGLLGQPVRKGKQMQTTWEPIKSAPKDGTKIIAYWAKSDHCEDATLHYYDDGERWYHVLFDGQQLNDEPTHWMPMPKAGIERPMKPQEED